MAAIIYKGILKISIDIIAIKNSRAETRKSPPSKDIISKNEYSEKNSLWKLKFLDFIKNNEISVANINNIFIVFVKSEFSRLPLKKVWLLWLVTKYNDNISPIIVIIKF